MLLVWFVVHQLTRASRHGRSARWLLQLLSQSLAHLSSEAPYLTASMLQRTVDDMTIDPRSALLPDLSAADVTLLVALAVVERNLELSSYSFENAYQAYSRLLRTQNDASGTKPVW